MERFKVGDYVRLVRENPIAGWYFMDDSRYIGPKMRIVRLGGYNQKYHDYEYSFHLDGELGGANVFDGMLDPWVVEPRNPLEASICSYLERERAQV